MHFRSEDGKGLVDLAETHDATMPGGKVFIENERRKVGALTKSHNVR